MFISLDKHDPNGTFMQHFTYGFYFIKTTHRNQFIINLNIYFITKLKT